jgi:hypothetical protein
MTNIVVSYFDNISCQKFSDNDSCQIQLRANGDRNWPKSTQPIVFNEKLGVTVPQSERARPPFGANRLGSPYF